MPEPTQPTETIDPEELAVLLEETLPAGFVVGQRYVIRRVIGRGGYAIVYEAYDQQLEIAIALKVLRPERASLAALNRFRREVHLPRRVSSPYVARVFDIGSEGPWSYLTMELIEGESLRERLHRGPLDVSEAIRIGQGIFHGLAALHAANIIHRDVKPENVLLCGDQVKLSDFGLSRYVDDEKLTTTGHIVGTMSYLAPEQIEGHSADARADLYAAGLVMFEMLAGKTPFPAESSLGVMLNRLKSPAPDVRKLRRDTPVWLANLVGRLLERNASARYASAEDVLAAMEARHAARPRSARRRLTALIVSLAILMAIAITAFLLYRTRVEHRFSHFVALPERGIAAISTGGQTLWENRAVSTDIASRWVFVRRTPGGPRELAMFLAPLGDVAFDHVRRLSFVDPQTGHVNRTVLLPGTPKSFPRCPARYYPGRILASDLNGDGVDEVVTWFGHVPEWPSIVVLYDPLTDRSRVVFEGYGQHGIDSLVDIDGDGKKELMLFGYNNGLGWFNVLAALRLDAPWSDAPERSPDWGVASQTANALLFYALLPKGSTSGEPAVSVDPKSHLLRVRYSSRMTVLLTPEGFLTTDRSPLPPAQRQAARFEAYRHLREAFRMRDARSYDVALSEMDAAVRSAQTAADSILVEAMRKERGQILVAAGRTAEAEAVFQELLPHAVYDAETAYDAARAYHLHGDLDRALEWYRRGFTLRARAETGKSIHEFLQGMVFVHTERHDWTGAEAEIDRFQATFGMESEWTSLYRQFVRWRSGQLPITVRNTWMPTDVLRYWALEFRHARGEDPRAVLRDVENEIAAGNSETQSAMWSLRAELLAQLGRTAEARDAIVQARAFLAEDIGFTPIARAHAELVEQRAAKIGGT